MKELPIHFKIEKKDIPSGEDFGNHYMEMLAVCLFRFLKRIKLYIA